MMLVWFQVVVQVVVVGVLVGLCQRQLQFWVRKLEMIQECAATTKNTAMTHRSLCFAALVEVAKGGGRTESANLCVILLFRMPSSRCGTRGMGLHELH